MNKIKFLNQLNNKLKKLPYDEVKNAISYYEEYFDEAGKENEQKVIEELGTPSTVASQIIANFVIKDSKNSENSTKKGLSTLWMVILAILASPIALPLAFAIVCLVFAFLIVIFALIFSFGSLGTALFLAGFVYIIVSIFILFEHFATGIFFIGFGLLCIGSGIASLKATIFLSRKSFRWIANKISNFLLRRNEK